jgi:hypothetical protein
MEYRLHYGFLNAGNAIIGVDPSLFSVNNRICFRYAVKGWSSPFINLGFKIKDYWASYVDTSTLVTYKSVRDIEEGRYKLHEEVLFDYDSNVAYVSRKHPDREKEALVCTIPGFVTDIVSAFFELRLIDFNTLNIGDTINTKVFFDKENYNFKVRYLGKGVVKTDAGKFNALKLVPVMPKNALFDGEESIKAWISDDKNKIPLLAEVEMFVGSVRLEITSYQNLKHPISIKQN